MWRYTRRGLAARKWRLATTALAIVLGVGFVIGTLVLSDTMTRTFDDLFSDANKGTDAYVRAVSQFGDDAGRGRLDASVLEQVRATPGVAAASGGISGSVSIVGADGKSIGSGGAPSFATNWVSEERLNPFRIAEGRAPTQPGEFAVDRSTAKQGALRVGAPVKLQLPNGTETFTLVGIARFGSVDSLAGAQVALFSLSETQRVLGAGGEFGAISAAASPGVDQAQLKAALQQRLGTGKVEVLTGAEITKENQSDIKKGLSGFTTFLSVFGYIALFVGVFIIYNTFAILVAQRQRESALLRAIGASRAQVRRSVIGEAVMIGVIAAGLGVAFGVLVAAGIKGLFGAIGLDLPATGLRLAPNRVVQAIILGALVTALSAWLPARRASRIAPVAALRDAAIDRSGTSLARLIAGLVALAATAALLVSGATAGGASAAARVGVAFAVAIVTAAILGPLVARPLARVLGAPIARLRGMSGVLARENAARSPKRTAATALALTIGVSVVSFVLVLAQSLKVSINEVVDKAVKADYIVESKDFSGFSPAVAKAIAATPGVSHATGLRYGQVELDGDVKEMLAVDPAAINSVYDANIAQGRIEDLGTDGFATTDRIAAKRGWKIGDAVPVVYAKTGPARLKLVALYDGTRTQGSNYLISHANFDANFDDRLDWQIYIRAADGADAAGVRTAIDRVLADYPSLILRDRAEYKRAQAQQINQLVTIIYVLLALAIFIALLGIANTVSLSIFERRRELGLLRAVGMSRRQLRSTVRWEAAIISLVGTVIGIAIGVVFGLAILRPLRSIGLGSSAVPTGQLLITALIGAAAGVLAAWRPARRAAKTDVLTAIAQG